MQDSLTYSDIVKGLHSKMEIFPIHKPAPAKESRFKVERVLTRIVKTVNNEIINLSIFSGKERVIELIFPSKLPHVEFKGDLLERFLKEDKTTISLIVKETHDFYRPGYPYDDYDEMNHKFGLQREGEIFHFLTVTNSWNEREISDESFTMTIGNQSHKFW